MRSRWAQMILTRRQGDHKMNARPPRRHYRESPLSDGAIARSHKGSSRQLHKTHAVGHGRHPHTRVPSYGKGLHKLSKLGPGNTADTAGRAKLHTRSASDTPSTSPTISDVKRSSSHANLSKSGSKVAFKQSHSHVSLSRNASTAKVGNQSKSEKAQTKANLRKRGTNDAPLNGTASFELGDDDQDDEWTEDSSSPYTTRQNSAAPSRPKTPLIRDPPSPDYSQDDPPEKSSTNLPHSPPDSPNPEREDIELHPEKQRKQSRYDPPDPQVVTNRLLSRNSSHYTPLSETSNVSASITPVRSSSPVGNLSGNTITLPKEQSIPLNGISRFLNASGSGKESVTPGSISHLQSNLARLDSDAEHTSSNTNSRIQPQSTDFLPKPSPKNLKVKPEPSPSSRRSKSSTKLNRNRSSLSTPSPPISPASTVRPSTEKLGPSPFESARGANPAAGKSLTQLKLDLERISSQRADAPRQPHNNPLMRNGYGGMLNTAGLFSGETDMAARVGRQWEKARKEVEGSKRFAPEVVQGPLLARHTDKKGDDDVSKKHHMKARSVTGSHGSGDARSLQGRGRIRFDVGSSGKHSFEEERAGEETARETDHESLESLLRRMWVSGEVEVGE